MIVLFKEDDMRRIKAITYKDVYKLSYLWMAVWAGALTLLSAPAMAVNVCSSLSSFNNTADDASGVLQACINQTAVKDTLALPPGVYTLNQQIQINQPLTLTTLGKNFTDPKCDVATSAGCAELKASFNFVPPATQSGLLLVTESASGTIVDHLVINGDRTKRVGSPAAMGCQKSNNSFGINVNVRASNFTFINSVSKYAVCGTGLQFAIGDKSVFSNSTFAYNGVHDQSNLWADGLTIVGNNSTVSNTNFTVSNNEFIDNTDVDLIFGSCQNCRIQNNIISHTGAFSGSSFAALMIQAWPNATSGNYTGSDVSGNQIICNYSCGFGLLIGGDPWYYVDIIGGTYHDNFISGAQQGFTINHAHDLSIYNNTVVPNFGGNFYSSCGMRVTVPYNISPTSFNIDRSKDNPATVYGNVDWTGCILNWWQLPPVSQAEWKQSKFIIGTFVDPPFVLPYSPSNTPKDTASLLTARAAYFNLLTGTTEVGPASFHAMRYRLDIADKANFKSLVTDQRFYAFERFNSPFDQATADQVTSNYMSLESNKRRAMLGYNIIDEPCSQPWLIKCNEPISQTKEWIKHLKTKDPAKLTYLNFAQFVRGGWELMEDQNQNGRFDNVIYENSIPTRQEFDLDHDGHLDIFEDTNYNGILDPGEDKDNNGKLDLVDSDWYELYLDWYLKDSDNHRLSEVVSFDHYPFFQDVQEWLKSVYFYIEVKPGTFIDRSYFYNLAIIRQKAGTRPFWAYPLSVGLTVQPPDGDLIVTVDADADHLRFMAFSPIAYGAKGLIYFTYSQPKSGQSEVYRSALVDADWKPTARYYHVQKINHYIHDIVGPAVMNSVHLGAFHKSNKPTEEPIPEDQKITQSTPLLFDVSDVNILIGLFRDASNYYALVVNKSLSTINKVTVALKGNWDNKVQLAPSVVSYKGGDAYSTAGTFHNAGITLVSIPSLAGGEGRLLKIAATSTVFTDLVGDRDYFHAGDVADVARQSPWLIATLGAIGASHGLGNSPGIDLDQGFVDRSVALTHVLPINAVITGAKVRFRLYGIHTDVFNDTILYDHSVSQGAGQPFLPFIALRDLLGREPMAGEFLNFVMDLSHIPIRTRDTSGGPGGHFTPNPDEYRNLLPLLADVEFNMIFGDDVEVDYSELEVTYANATSVVTFQALKPTSPPSTTDTTGCPVDFQGKYYFEALLTNISGMALSNLRVGINELSNNNLLLATDGERLEAGEWFDVLKKDSYGDQKLTQGEWVKVPFTVCMKYWKPFRLYVDVAGVAQ